MKNKYNDIPVYYCKNCLSLGIMDDSVIGKPFCIKCGSTEIATSSIIEWDFMYQDEYKKSFLDEE